MKKYLVHIVWVIVAVVAFVGGMYYGKSTIPAGRGSFAGFTASSTRAGFAGRGGAGAGAVIGQVTAMSSDSITVQLANGNSDVVFYSSSTPITEPTQVSPSVLTAGTNVMVGGTQNSDGSFTAQTIQVRPAGSGTGFGGATGTSGGTN
jgi:hypothetical protein